MNEQWDYVVVGHICRDVTPAGFKPGGTALFSATLAHQLGQKTAVLTSHSPNYDVSAYLPAVHLTNIPAASDTIFENLYEGNNRRQRLHGLAERLTPESVPAAYTEAKLVHLGPIAAEIDPHIVSAFPGRFIGLTPQGWLRQWDTAGWVSAQPFAEAEWLFPLASAVVISEEDLLDDQMLIHFKSWAKLLVMTQSARGCTIFSQGQSWQLPAPAVSVVEPTGAGDLFATGFFVRLAQTGQPLLAAEFANQLAAASITQTNLADKVTAWQKLTHSR